MCGVRENFSKGGGGGRGEQCESSIWRWRERRAEDPQYDPKITGGVIIVSCEVCPEISGRKPTSCSHLPQDHWQMVRRGGETSSGTPETWPLGRDQSVWKGYRMGDAIVCQPWTTPSTGIVFLFVNSQQRSLLLRLPRFYTELPSSHVSPAVAVYASVRAAAIAGGNVFLTCPSGPSLVTSQERLEGISFFKFAVIVTLISRRKNWVDFGGEGDCDLTSVYSCHIKSHVNSSTDSTFGSQRSLLLTHYGIF